MLKGKNKINEANVTNSNNTNYITNSYIENYMANRVIINIGEMDTEEEAIQTEVEDFDLFN